MRARTWVAGCAALLLLAGCAPADDAEQGPTTLGELGAAYLDAGGACDDLVQQYQAADDAPEVATCGSETVLTIASDDEQAAELRVAALLRGAQVLAGGRWLVEDPDAASLQEGMGGDLARLDPRDGPRDLADGLLVGADGAIPRDPVPAQGAPEEPDVDGQVITVAVDPTCAFCDAFLEANGEQLDAWAADGSATIDYRPVALGGRGIGTDDASFGEALRTSLASSLGVMAAACVADEDADAVLPLLRAMLADDELDSAAVSELAEDAVPGAGDCVSDGTFAWWARQATARALEGPMPDGEQLRGVPSVYVGDRLYAGDVSDAQAFADFVAEG